MSTKANTMRSSNHDWPTKLLLVYQDGTRDFKPRDANNTRHQHADTSRPDGHQLSLLPASQPCSSEQSYPLAVPCNPFGEEVSSMFIL